MKIDRRGFLAASSSALVFAKHQLSPTASAAETSAGPQNKAAVARRQVAICETADKTNHRLTATGTVDFKPHGQPLETQICVFVDPTKTFQTFLGIGGALTDASAETFAKLPTPKQQEILKAYFDPQAGIGYTLARTNIHSCDF